VALRVFHTKCEDTVERNRCCVLVERKTWNGNDVNNTEPGLQRHTCR
jgi:hypothetical protein